MAAVAERRRSWDALMDGAHPMKALTRVQRQQLSCLLASSNHLSSNAKRSAPFVFTSSSTFQRRSVASEHITEWSRGYGTLGFRRMPQWLRCEGLVWTRKT